MPLILRKIRKSKWLIPSWLSKGDIQADALVDLSTKNNELSVWYITDDKSNFERIISALAAHRDHLSNFDYVLFDKKFLDENNIKIRKTKGISLDEEVNELWHLDLYELSVLKIVNLAKTILENGEIKRIQERDVGQFIIKTITSGNINLEKLKENIKEKIEKHF